MTVPASSTKTKQKIKTRSGFETSILNKLIKDGVEFEYEGLKLEYVLYRLYKPDIQLSNGIVIELKGYFPYEDREKMIAAKKSHPYLDIRIVFMEDNYTTKLSKSSRLKRLDKIKNGDIVKQREKYSDWAVKHGFKYSIGHIPGEWIDEDNGV